MIRYVERIVAVSKRVKGDTVARSFEGREMLVITVTSEANQARLADIQRDAQRIADPRGEASGVKAGLALRYQLAAGTDADTKLALDSTVVLLDPN